MYLFQAILDDNKERVLELLDEGRSLGNLNNEGCTPLMLAAASDRMDVFEILLDHGAKDLHAEPITGQTVLMELASHGNLKIVQRLLKAGTEPNQSDRDHTTALQFAASAGHSEIVSLLLEHGALIDHQDRSRRTSLSLAVCHRHLE